MIWFILYRNGGREVTDMVVAWLDKATADAEIEAYVDWDRKASGATSWELVSVPRQKRQSYFKPPRKKSDPTDLIEYHYVLEDLRVEGAEETLVRAI